MATQTKDVPRSHAGYWDRYTWLQYGHPGEVVVAVECYFQGEQIDWAAYAGNSVDLMREYPEYTSPEDAVAKRGSKVSEDLARRVFRQIEGRWRN